MKEEQEKDRYLRKILQHSKSGNPLDSSRMDQAREAALTAYRESEVVSLKSWRKVLLRAALFIITGIIVGIAFKPFHREKLDQHLTRSEAGVLLNEGFEIFGSRRLQSIMAVNGRVKWQVDPEAGNVSPPFWLVSLAGDRSGKKISVVAKSGGLVKLPSGREIEILEKGDGTVFVVDSDSIIFPDEAILIAETKPH